MADRLVTRTAAAVFDEAATAYDVEFSATGVGARLREFVWSRLAPFVKPGMHVLDLGCGTGEDAVWLARKGCRVIAADGSPAMLEQVAAKAKRLDLAHRIRPTVLDLNAPLRMDAPPGYPFDLVISNFGAINCVEDLASLTRKLEAWTKPGGVVALVYMGRFCAWESAYYLARLDRRATRRWRGKANARVGSQDLVVRYWSSGELMGALQSSFRVLGVCGIGTFLPPSFLFHAMERLPPLFHVLARLDQLTSRLWPFSRMGDHTLVILRRRDLPSVAGTAR